MSIISSYIKRSLRFNGLSETQIIESIARTLIKKRIKCDRCIRDLTSHRKVKSEIRFLLKRNIISCDNDGFYHKVKAI